MRAMTMWGVAGNLLGLCRVAAWITFLWETVLSVITLPLRDPQTLRAASGSFDEYDFAGVMAHAPLFAVLALAVALATQFAGTRIDFRLAEYGGVRERSSAPVAPEVPESPELSSAPGEIPEFGEPRVRPRPAWGRCVQALGAALNVAAVIAYLLVAAALFGLFQETQLRHHFDPATPGWTVLTAVLGRLAQVTGPRLIRHGRRHRVVVPDSMARCLSEPFALYLRPFDKDGVIASHTPGLPSLPHYFNTSGSTLTVEEMLSATLRPAGRLLAVGEPEDALPPPGAARVYLPLNNWQPTVLSLMDEARLVVLGTGLAPGTLWEFGQAVRRCPPARLVLAVYSDAAEYREFRKVADRLLPEGCELPALPGPDGSGRLIGGYPLKGVIVFDDDWTPTLLPVDLTVTRLRIRGRVNEDVRLQLHAMFQQVLGRLGLSAPGPEPVARRKRARALGAMILGGCLQGTGTALFPAWALGTSTGVGQTASALAQPLVFLQPVGALLAAAAADRWGRRPATLATAAVMGLVPLVLMLPAHGQLPGFGVPLSMSLFLLAVGGELVLAVVLLSESAKPGRAGTVLGWYLAGSYVGGTVLSVTVNSASGGSWPSWLPLTAAALGLAAVWLRHGMQEPRGLRQFHAPEAGLFEALRRHRGLSAAGVLLGLGAGFGLTTWTVVPAYDDPGQKIQVAMLPIVLLALLMPLLGRLADRFRRGPLLAACAAGLALVQVAAALSGGWDAADAVTRNAAALLSAAFVPAVALALVAVMPARIRATGVAPLLAPLLAPTGVLVALHQDFDVRGQDWRFPLVVALLYAAGAVVALRTPGIGRKVLDR